MNSYKLLFTFISQTTMKKLKQVIGVLLVYTLLALPLSLFIINTELVVCAPDIS